VLRSNTGDLIDVRDSLATHAFAGGFSAVMRRAGPEIGGIANFNREVRTRSGGSI
jgi:hypothetical protein